MNTKQSSYSMISNRDLRLIVLATLVGVIASFFVGGIMGIIAIAQSHCWQIITHSSVVVISGIFLYLLAKQVEKEAKEPEKEDTLEGIREDIHTLIEMIKNITEETAESSQSRR